ncbi:MAG: hypothetical protein JWO53_1391, partial [Chlamydiia bacterium]|nr:hypothetical protein [Chlamydiia bacterium]
MIPINGQFLNATQSSSLSSTTPTQLEERKSGEEDSTVEKMANLGINGLLGNESKARKLLNFSIIPTGRKIVLEDLPPNLLGSIGSYLGSGKNSGILEFFINIPKEPLGTINTNMFEHNREAVLGERLKIDGRLVGTILKNAGNSLSAISPYL